LLHLSRERQELDLQLSANAISPAKKMLGFRTVVMRTNDVDVAMEDTLSDLVLCVKGRLTPIQIRSFRMAVYHRFRCMTTVHQQLRDDLRGRVRKKRRARPPSLDPPEELLSQGAHAYT
jgi:hypothetical protein